MGIFERWRIECNIDFVDSRMATYFPNLVSFHTISRLPVERGVPKAPQVGVYLYLPSFFRKASPS